MIDTTQKKEWIELGYISGFSGVRGWVKLYSYTRPRENIKQYRQFYTNVLADELLDFCDIKKSGKHIIGKIKSVNNREEAEVLLGKKLWIKASELKKSPDEFFWHELIGLNVINLENENLGTVVELMETGANDVLVVKNLTDKNVLIPYVKDYYILSVDLENKILSVDWQIDWLEDN